MNSLGMALARFNLSNQNRILNEIEKSYGVNAEKKVEKQLRRLRKASQEFEAVLITTLFKNFRKSLPGESLFGKSFAMKIYREMRDEKFAEEMAKREEFGIARLLYENLAPAVIRANLRYFPEKGGKT